MSRRALKAINWAALAERVPEREKNMLATFKAKSEQYLRRVQEFPESAPKIDWAHYKNVIAVPGMVDTFQKHYESMQIPFPADNYTKIVEQEEKEIMVKVEEFISKAAHKIENTKAEIDALNKRIPEEEMTMEEFVEAHPDFRIGTVSRPSIFPHTEEFQPEYVEREMAEAAKKGVKAAH